MAGPKRVIGSERYGTYVTRTSCVALPPIARVVGTGYLSTADPPAMVDATTQDDMTLFKSSLQVPRSIF